MTTQELIEKAIRNHHHPAWLQAWALVALASALADIAAPVEFPRPEDWIDDEPSGGPA